MTQLYWVGWVIAALALMLNFWKELKINSKEQREKEEARERRLLQLEINEKVDKAQLEGELRLLRQQVAQAQGTASQANQLIKTALSHE